MDMFAKCSTWLAGNLSVKAIDWAALAARGTPGVFNREYVTQYMVPAFGQAGATMASLDLKPGTLAQVMSDYYDLRSKLGEEADSVLRVVGTAVQLTNPVLMTTVPWSAANNVLWYLWSTTTLGVQAHFSGAILKAGLDTGEIARHASLVTMSCNLLSQLDKVGALKFFKKGEAPTSGLGAVPAAVIVIAIVLVIALAWAAVAIYETSRINARIDAACTKAIQTGDAADQAMCQQMQASSNPLSKQVPDAVSGLLEKVSIASMIGAGLWMMVQFGPGIATKVKQSISAYKSS